MSQEEFAVAAVAPLDLLVERVQGQYRRLTQQALPSLAAQAQECAAAASVLGRFGGKLAAHIRREDELLYPVLTQMIAVPEPDPAAPLCNSAPCRFCTVGHALFMFEQEHEALNALAAELGQAVLAASSSLRSAVAEFAVEFAALTRLENDVIFPRAIQLERRLKGLPEVR